MAETSVARGSASAKQLWLKDVFERTRKESILGKLQGGTEAVIYSKTDLEKEKGEKINFDLLGEIDPLSVTIDGEDHTAAANAISIYSDSVTISFYNIPCSVRLGLSEKRTAYDLPKEAENKLIKAGADFFDMVCFGVLEDSPTLTFYTASGVMATTSTVATAKLAVTSTDKLTPDMISRIAVFANAHNPTAGGQHNIGQVKYNGITVKGVLFVSPDVFADLILDATFYNKCVVAAAELRGKNPIFDGSDVIMHNGVAVIPHPNVYSDVTGGAGGNVPFSQCVFVGASSLMVAWGGKPNLHTETYNMGQNMRMGYQLYFGVKKPVFNSLDQGSISVVVAHSNAFGRTARTGIIRSDIRGLV